MTFKSILYLATARIVYLLKRREDPVERSCHPGVIRSLSNTRNRCMDYWVVCSRMLRNGLVGGMCLG